MPVQDRRLSDRDSPLARSLAAVAGLGVVPDIREALEATAGEAMLGLRDSILDEIPAFEQSNTYMDGVPIHACSS